MMSCPHCGKEARSVQGLSKHLSGTRAYGGHDMAVDAARQLAESMANRGMSVTSARQPERVEPLRRAAPPASPVALSPEAERSFLAAVMSSMASHKALPKYQFERRVDAFLAVLLPDLLGQLLGTEVSFVVPEFPLKKDGSNQSTNVDHVYFDRRGRWLFVELKTDEQSVQQDQVDVYLRAARRGMAALLADVRAIRQATNQPIKYGALLDSLARFPADGPIEVLYLAPASSRVSRSAGLRVVSYAELAAFDHRTFPEAWDLFRKVLVPAIE